ncbi:hypothetical protein SISNIDRAFT_125280 [Sistotremastrum niveocremeum HHB9708]|uniref:Uncharacterized protein n=1 Tax=Sistotremastrum niveocremeum HHB9708 TaxID=1314777 RepID=A0A164TAQ6_9AGAM|nr:hypothetical protein SISNIDRAFT_125280 [Sistotremastrum niveocremeum HHB9708]
MLTTAVVIPAIIQKSQQALTLYHAVQVLNFATFSSVTSLAVAPLCHIWRQTGEGKVAETLSQFDGDAGFDGGVLLDEDEDDPQVRIRKLQEGQIQISRVVLSGALIIQICLQWTWAIILFTDTTYAQAPCSDLTLLYFFGIPLHASDINHGSYYIFPLWLLFNMCISLFWGILLVVTSNPDMHPVLSRAQTELDPESAISEVINNITKFGIPYRDRKRMLLLGVNVLAVIVAAFILITSELEAWKNCILLGENTTWGFGQITAILLSLTPGGSLVVAVYDKHIVHERKRQELRRISEANSNPLSSEASFTMSPADSPLIRLQRASAVHFPSSTSHSSTLEPPGSHAPTNALGLSAYESSNAANPTVLRPALEDVLRARPKRRLSASSHSSNHLLPT